MKNASICARNLTTLLKKIGGALPPRPPVPDDPIEVLVMSFLMWESATEKAAAGYEAIMKQVVDFNDLRVSMPHEVAGWLGPDYPRALDRAQRLRAVLRSIYLREHAVSLDRLRKLGKREVRKYLESLEGILPYVAARVMLLCFGAHAVPVDDQLRTRLIQAGAADVSAEVPSLAAWLTRQIKAEDGLQSHYAFQRWIDELAAKPEPRTAKSSKRSSAAKPATKKRASAAKKTVATRTAGDG
ncbi:MAG: hypothetical protein JSV91_10875 [Phycisphaerales bacterium]|nr:MAG: hypothetical protein JSV91_10875 [Phycisphaerales bacterium]